jgi:hypothetical protein
MNVQWKQLLQFALTVIIGLAFDSPGRAVNLVYFRNTSPRGLYDFDTDTQQSTLRVGVPSGSSLTSLAVRPSDGTVFGINGGPHPDRLVRLDINTGGVIEVGILYSNSNKLAIQPGTGTLWSMGAISDGSNTNFPARALYTVNPTNANETLVGILPFAGFGGTALEFLEDGTLLCTFGGTLYRLDPATTELTPIGMSPQLTGLRDFAHVGNRLFATGPYTGSIFYIFEIDVATAHATPLAPITLGLIDGGLFEILPLSKLTISVASVSIKFPSLIGTTYQVQYRSPRTLDIWTDLGERIPGTGNEISVLDSALDDSHRTYRLQMFP